MNRALFLPLAGIAALGMLFTGCGGDAEVREDGQTEAEAKLNNLQAISKIADPVEAIGAAERQLGYLAAGLWERSYADVHPTQQVLFTGQQYAECMRKSFGGGAIISNFESQGAEKLSLDIPGTTSVEPAAIKVSVSYTIDRAGKSETRSAAFNQTVVDGQWRFAVDDPASIASGRC